MPKFFISYRHSDREGQYLAHMLFRELKRRYGEPSVFLDVDSRNPGLAFPEKVEQALRQTDVVLVVIGPDWLRILNERRDDDRDWVRYEVRESLKRKGLLVVPVWLPGVAMPQRTQLPEELADLVDRDGSPIDPFRDFDSHLSRLLRDVEQVLENARGTEAARVSARLAAIEAEVARVSPPRANRPDSAPRQVPPPSAVPAQSANRPTAEMPSAESAPVAPPVTISPPPPAAVAPRATPPSSVKTAASPGPPGPSAQPAPPKSAAPSPRTAGARAQAARPDASPLAPERSTSQPARFYTASRRLTPLRWLLALVSVAPILLCLAYGYSSVLVDLPFVQLNVLVTILYGSLCGGATLWMFWRWKVRRAGMLWGGHLVSGVGAVYLSWVTYFSAWGSAHGKEEAGLLTFLFRPGLVWSLVRELAGMGWWQAWTYRPTGIVLWVVWSLEAAIIAFIVWVFAFYLTERMFCEACRNWCPEPSTVAKLAVTHAEAEALGRLLRARDLGALRGLPASSGNGEWLEVQLSRCGSCGTTNALSVSHWRSKIEADGKRSWRSTSLLWRLLISNTEADEIEKIGPDSEGYAKSF